MKHILSALVALALVISACKKEVATPPPTNEPAKGTAGSGAIGNGSGGSEAAPAADKKNPEGCNSDFAQDIQADITLTEKCSPYTLTRDVGLEVNVTIEPGVEFQAKDGAAFSVGYNARGKLIAKGTVEKPIRFVAEHKEPGSWWGVRVFSKAPGSTLENVIIEHAGSPDLPALLIEGAEATLKNVKLVGVKHQALKVSAETTKEVTGLDLREAGGDADALLETNLASAKAFGTGNQYPEKAVISLLGSADRDTTISFQGVPWRFSGELAMNAPEGKTATLTIEAGVVLQAAESAAITIGYNGTGALKVLGTAEKPVTISRFGPDAKTTPWGGVGLFSNAQAAHLEYLRIENTGADRPAIRVENARGLGTMNHLTIANCTAGGIRIESARDRFISFDNNTLTDISGGAAIRLPIELAHVLGASNTFGPKMSVELFGTTERDVTLTALPYRLTGEVAVNGKDGTLARLTVEPGAALQIAEGASVVLGYGQAARLTLKGTSDKKISITSQSASSALHAFNASVIDIENVAFTGIASDEAAIVVEEQVTGFVKNSSFKGSKFALKKCGSKVEHAGLKAEGAMKVEFKCE